MKTSDVAKALGRLGGKARAKKLSPERKREIASLGGKARAQSILAVRRIEENFRYVDVIRELSGKPPKVKRLKTFKGRLPGIYPEKL